uniref:Apple domain-containing protein n=1 Tax=Syphacia muris TaxID=451379 RepID=A0A0N5AAC3_9BILA
MCSVNEVCGHEGKIGCVRESGAFSACDQSHTATFIRTDSFTSTDSSILSLDGVSEIECEIKCLEISECESFIYNWDTSLCDIYDVSNPAISGLNQQSSSTKSCSLFQKVCLPADFHCSKSYAFQRFGQHILIGTALQVINASDVVDCLISCLKSDFKFRLECRSVIYYYESRECILNRENRMTVPEAFKLISKAEKVDYFDNLCFSASCLDGFETHWVKINTPLISDLANVVVIKNTTDYECIESCLNNIVGGQNFPCHVFSYNKDIRYCYAIAEPQLWKPLTINSDRNNFNITKDCFEKICLPSKILNSKRLTPQGEVSGILQDGCYLIGKMKASTIIPSARPQRVNYFLNTCTRAEIEDSGYHDTLISEDLLSMHTTSASAENGNGKMHNSSNDTRRVQVDKKLNSVMVYVNFGKNDLTSDTKQAEAINNVNGEKIYCHDGKLHLRFATPTSAIVSIDNQTLESCQKKFYQKLVVEYEINKLMNACPPVQFMPQSWLVFTVAKNDNSAKKLKVTCILSPKRKSLTNSNLLSNKFTIGFWVVHNGMPVSKVAVGEKVELRWLIFGPRLKRDFLIRLCTAETVDENALLSPVILVKNGCTNRNLWQLGLSETVTKTNYGFSTNITAFRFKGSTKKPCNGLEGYENETKVIARQQVIQNFACLRTR